MDQKTSNGTQSNYRSRQLKDKLFQRWDDLFGVTRLNLLKKTANTEHAHPGYQITEFHTYSPAILQHYKAQGRVTMSESRLKSRFHHGMRFFVLTQGHTPVATTWIATGGRFIDEAGIFIGLANQEPWIRDIFINKEERGKGLFAVFLDLLIREHLPTGENIWSDVSTRNKGSLITHQRYGFTKIDEVHIIQPCDHILFRKHLPTSHLYQLSGFQIEKKLVWTGEVYWHYIQNNIA